jgi:hypothetical protein
MNSEGGRRNLQSFFYLLPSSFVLLSRCRSYYCPSPPNTTKTSPFQLGNLLKIFAIPK